mgnify:CR=1 FL=1
MKIKLELYGASRDFSSNEYLEFDIKEKITIKDFKNEIIDYLKKNLRENENFKKIVETSAFCSEENKIISNNYKIIKKQKIGIIPPIGGG